MQKIIIFTRPNFIGVVCVNIIIDIVKVKNYEIIYLIIPIKTSKCSIGCNSLSHVNE